jgi:hypothetical protein
MKRPIRLVPSVNLRWKLDVVTNKWVLQQLWVPEIIVTDPEPGEVPEPEWRDVPEIEVSGDPQLSQQGS